MTYKQKLSEIIKSSKSNLVIGLDTDFDKVPATFLRYKNPILAFNLKVIESTYDYCAGYKINLAFYEAAGTKGIEAMEETVKAIPRNRIKICDAKRGDIGNTSELYAKAYFDNLHFDSITLSPYMGFDSVSPFLERKDKLVYILVRTSNSGAEDFQTLKVGSKELHEVIARKSLEWSKNQIGFVVGANRLKEIKKYSSAKEKIPLLIPGIGAQGNDLKNLMKNLQNKLFLINASRSIIYAGNVNDTQTDYFPKVIAAAKELNKSINSYKK
jgi:orotidine-5'-phosphate decarboxylase